MQPIDEKRQNKQRKANEEEEGCVSVRLIGTKAKTSDDDQRETKVRTNTMINTQKYIRIAKE